MSLLQAYLDILPLSGLDFPLGSPTFGAKLEEGTPHHRGGNPKAAALAGKAAEQEEGTPGSALIASSFHHDSWSLHQPAWHHPDFKHSPYLTYSIDTM